MNILKQLVMNKCIIITGSNGLLGKHLVNYFKKKYLVLAIDLNTQLENSNSVIEYTGDITLKKTWDDIKNIITEKELYLHGLINCAAITNATRSSKKEIIEAFNETLNVNVGAQYLAIETLTEIMKSQKFGRIINIGSLYASVAPTPRLYIDSSVIQTPGYTVSKHAVVGLTKFYAAQLIKDGITVNCISPGGIFDNQDKSFLSKYLEQNPSGRMASPGDFISIIKSLLEEDNSYITGQNISIDGGWTII